MFGTHSSPSRWFIGAAAVLTTVAAAGCGNSNNTTTSSGAAAATTCPSGGLKMAVEPFDDSSKLLPVYNQIVSQFSQALGCPVSLTITTNYSSEVEAMRNNKLDIAEFGPLGYVLAAQVANAQSIVGYADKTGAPATYTASVVSWPGSGASTLAQCAGKSFAYSDPASTSGYLFPAYALKSKASIDPQSGVQAEFAGSHGATYQALVNHKVICGELNSDTISSNTKQGTYNASNFVTLWQSDPIPNDPIAVRAGLPQALKDKIKATLVGLDLSNVSDPNGELIGVKFVTWDDGKYNGIRALVSTLNLNLNSLVP